MGKYKKAIVCSQANNAFIVTVPELPSCMADGATREEAIRNADIVISEWIEFAKESGTRVPAPRCEAVLVQERPGINSPVLSCK